jgi:acyl-CoA synthetase (AMP-forming)/AMP-acid ligase II
MLTHRNIYLHALNSSLSLHTDNDSVELHTIPLFHANGWGVAHFLTLLGSKHVMIQRFDPPEVFRLIEKERVHYCSLVPAMATALVNCPERKKYDLDYARRRRVVTHVGAGSRRKARVHLFLGLRLDGDFTSADHFSEEAGNLLGGRRAFRRASDDGLCHPWRRTSCG